MTQPANSPTLLHLPDVYEGYLTSTQLTEFFRDIRQFAEVLDVFCKSAPRTMSGLRDAKLENVEAELMSGRARAVQVRYRFEGKEWRDTVLHDQGKFKVVRLAMPEFTQ